MAGTALITGGTGGLGAAVVRTFLDRGWRVVLTWMSDAERDRVPDHDNCRAVRCDLFEPDEVAAAVREAAGLEQAQLEAVVNLVGGYEAAGRVESAPVESFEKLLRLNLRPTYLVTQQALPELTKSGGAIVCISARAALQPFSGAAGYIASKAAVLAFAQAVAVEYKDQGVRCNAVLPSVIDTPANRAAQPDADHSRWVAPAEIADVIHYLCSDESAPISGAAIPVYGRA